MDGRREERRGGEKRGGKRRTIGKRGTAGENIKTPILSVLIENISVKNNVSERLCERFLNPRALDVFIEVLQVEPQSITL